MYTRKCDVAFYGHVQCLHFTSGASLVNLRSAPRSILSKRFCWEQSFFAIPKNENYVVGTNRRFVPTTSFSIFGIAKKLCSQQFQSRVFGGIHAVSV